MAKRSARNKDEVPKVNKAVRTQRVKFLLTSDTHYGFNHKTHQRHETFLEGVQLAIKEEGVNCVVHAGDWSVNKQDQFYRTMKMFRKYIPLDIPIVCVRGNHDFWDYAKDYGYTSSGRKMHWGEMQQAHNKWFEEFNIHHLESGPFIVEDVIVCGFDGWYGQANPPTNDESQMIGNIEGCPTMVYHSSRAYKELMRVLDTDTDAYAKAVCVSHFPPFGGDYKNGHDPKDLRYSANPRYLDPITEKFDVFCMGHSHGHVDRIDNNCRLLNAGSDYNLPKYLIFDV